MGTPHANLSISTSKIPYPKGKTRQKIIDGLFKIHKNWKQQLESLNNPYHLKIWFYNPDVSKSQIVCAINSHVSFYTTIFYDPKIDKLFPFKPGNLIWQYREHQAHFSIEESLGQIEDWVSEKAFNEQKNG